MEQKKRLKIGLGVAAIGAVVGAIVLLYPTPYKPVNYDMTISMEEGSYSVFPPSEKQWSLHPKDTITFHNSTTEKLTVKPVPGTVFIESEGAFTVPEENNVKRTLADLQQADKPALSILFIFGDEDGSKGPRMVVTDSSS